jgi:hypothetical protein
MHKFNVQGPRKAQIEDLPIKHREDFQYGTYVLSIHSKV